MMQEREEEALSGYFDGEKDDTSDDANLLGKEIRFMARMHGIELGEVIKCEMKGYLTLKCLDKLKSGQKSAIAVYNPNLES